MFKRILYILFGLFLMAQLFQPDRTAPPVDPATDMLAMTHAPEDVRSLVRAACYDCHSHATAYPWYARITPVNFWLQDHINEAREELNFSRWDEYAGGEEAAECGEAVAEGEMPLASYTPLHPEARLTPEQRDRLATWFDANLGAGKDHD